MNDQSWFNWTALLLAASLIVGFGIGLGLGTSFGAPPAKAPTVPPASAVDRVYLTISFNPSTGMDQYYPANFTVAPHSLVQVSITNYDNGSNVVPPMFAMVSGTVGETMRVQTGGAAAPQMMNRVDPSQIAHTFTVVGAPYHLNVPVPSAASLSAPSLISFAAFFNTTGTFTWVCMAPCDPGAMQSLGFMSGSVTVTG